jgi:hypothetical protein
MTTLPPSTTQYNFVLNQAIALTTGWDDSTVSFDELSNVTKIYYPVDNTSVNTPNTVSINYSNVSNGTDVDSPYIPTISQVDFQHLYTTPATQLLSYTIGNYIQKFINGNTTGLIPTGLDNADITILRDLNVIDNKTYSNLNYNFNNSWNIFITALQKQIGANIPTVLPGNIVMLQFTFIRNQIASTNTSKYTKHLLIYFKVV